MENKLMRFSVKFKKTFNQYDFDKIDNKDNKDKNLYTFYSNKDSKCYLINFETNEKEEIIKITREDNEIAKRILEVKQKTDKKSKGIYINRDDDAKKISDSFGKEVPPRIFWDFEMEYEKEEIHTFLRNVVVSTYEDENITFFTEKRNFKFNSNYINNISVFSYSCEFPIFLNLLIENEKISLEMEYKKINREEDNLITKKYFEKTEFNLNNGLTYYGERYGNFYEKMDNATTGSKAEFFIEMLSDEIINKVISAMDDYYLSKYGVKTNCVKLNSKNNTLKSYAFNPFCNIMYYYKPFFNTRFRTYFKRNDNTRNHLEYFCEDILKIPYSEKYIDLIINSYNNIFVAKCIYDSGIKKVENIIKIINTAISSQWLEYPLKKFVKKYYGDQTNYFVHNDNFCEEYRNDLCVYIKKALNYVDEDAFTEMFSRSFIQHNKYWQKSLSQIALLIDLNDCSRELLRKSCSYGLNRVHSDNIDLYFDKILTKNKIILYSEEEIKKEKLMSNFIYNHPKDMKDVVDIINQMHVNCDAKKLSIDAARKIKELIILKDNRNEPLACMVIQNRDLINLYITQNTLKYDSSEISHICESFIKENKIRRYLSKNKSSTPF